ncbi:MAG: hypothetical protein V3V41_08060 [Candidatus Heimdallarchaeota archaeon]
MTRTAICDFCLVEGKVTIAKYNSRTALRGNPIAVCTGHKKDARKIGGSEEKVLTLLNDAVNKVNSLRV